MLLSIFFYAILIFPSSCGPWNYFKNWRDTEWAALKGKGFARHANAIMNDVNIPYNALSNHPQLQLTMNVARTLMGFGQIITALYNEFHKSDRHPELMIEIINDLDSDIDQVEVFCYAGYPITFPYFIPAHSRANINIGTMYNALITAESRAQGQIRFRFTVSRDVPETPKELFFYFESTWPASVVFRPYNALREAITGEPHPGDHKFYVARTLQNIDGKSQQFNPFREMKKLNYFNEKVNSVAFLNWDLKCSVFGDADGGKRLKTTYTLSLKSGLEYFTEGKYQWHFLNHNSYIDIWQVVMIQEETFLIQHDSFYLQAINGVHYWKEVANQRATLVDPTYHFKFVFTEKEKDKGYLVMTDDEEYIFGLREGSAPWYGLSHRSAKNGAEETIFIFKRL